jgi:hypothetical protein
MDWWSRSFPNSVQEIEMSIAIDLAKPARDRAVCDPPVLVTRPKTKKLANAESQVARSHEEPAARSTHETQMLAVQLACTLTLLALCTVTFALAAWMLFDLAGSAMDQIRMLTPKQIIQGMAGR